MALILRPNDFQEANYTALLIKIIQTFEKAEPIFSGNVVPPEFQLFSENKGVQLQVVAPMTDENQLANWKVNVNISKTWEIEPYDTVRRKPPFAGERFFVLQTTDALALVQTFGEQKENWMLLDDLEVEPELGGFRKEGEGA